MYKLFLSIILLTIVPLHAKTLFLEKNDFYPVQFDILRDETGALKFSDVKNSTRFIPTTKNAFGFTTDVLWVRFIINVPENNTIDWFLEIGYPLIEQFDIYIPNKNEYATRRYGEKIPFKKRDIEHHTFLIPMSKEEGVYTYFIRFKTSSSMNVPIVIRSFKNVISEMNFQKTIFDIYYGALLIILVYNLLLAIYMRDKTYLWYGIFIIALILASLGLNGYGFQYLWPTITWVNDLIPSMLFFTQFSMAIFSLLYLNYREINKTHFLLMKLYISITIILTVASIFISYHKTILIAATSYMPGIFLVTLISIDRAIKKRREGYFFIVAFSLLLIGVIISLLNRFGILQNNFITLWAFQLGTLYCISLFSLGLAGKVNALKNDLAEINVHLEEKVQERTKQLSNAKGEIESAIVELEAMNDNLIQKNQELEEAEKIKLQDILMASRLQSSLLPKYPPESSKYDIAFAYSPMSGVSGDFYDFYIDNNKLIGVGLFDVSGHGIASSLITLMAKSIIAGTFVENRKENLGKVVEIINNKLISEIKNIENYLTGVFLRFSGDTIEYVNCAHPDIIYKNANTNRTGNVLDPSGNRIGGPLLGIDLGLNENGYGFKGITLKTQPEDCILLFTDSLIESVRSDGEEYSEIRIINALHNTPNATAQATLNTILNDFYKFLAPNKPMDDLTVLLIKRK